MGGAEDQAGGTAPVGIGGWERALAGGRVETVTAGHYTAGPDFGQRDRTLDQCILNLYLDGGMLATAAGRRVLLRPGSVLWLSPGVRHDFALARPGVPYAMINTRWRLWHHGRVRRPPEDLLVAHEAWELRPLFDLVVDDRQAGRPDAGERLLRILYLLYGDLRRADRAAGRGPGPGLSRRQRLALADHAHRHAAARPTPADLAAVVGLSPDWFRRVFRRSYGCSPRSWLVRERIRLAAQRLLDAPGSAIGRVAEEFGYQDVYLFSRQFRRVMGTSPSRWRRQG